MWRLEPCYDSLPPTWGTARWAITTMLACCWRGHVGTEYLPEWDGGPRSRHCHRCGRVWLWQANGEGG